MRTRTLAQVDPTEFRTALSRFATGVTIVTTLDHEDRPWGFTASAFTSLSLDPPMILTCLDKEANCYPAFSRSDLFVVSILRPHHQGLATRFASKVANKFRRGGLADRRHRGIPRVSDALASLLCRVEDRIPAGDHVILLAGVEEVEAEEGQPMLYFGGDFHGLAAAGANLEWQRSTST